MSDYCLISDKIIMKISFNFRRIVICIIWTMRGTAVWHTHATAVHRRCVSYWYPPAVWTVPPPRGAVPFPVDADLFHRGWRKVAWVGVKRLLPVFFELFIFQRFVAFSYCYITSGLEEEYQNKQTAKDKTFFW